MGSIGPRQVIAAAAVAVGFSGLAEMGGVVAAAHCSIPAETRDGIFILESDEIRLLLRVKQHRCVARTVPAEYSSAWLGRHRQRLHPGPEHSMIGRAHV